MSVAALLAQLRRLRTRHGREQSGLYAIEGLRLHERALRAGIVPQAVMMAASLTTNPAPRIRAVQDALHGRCPITFIPDTLAAELAEERELGAMWGILPLPPSADLRTQGTAVPHPLLLIATDVTDPGNVGALLRTAHAAGATAFVAVGVSDPFHPRAVRISRGSLFKLPITRYATLPPLLADLRHLGVTLVGTAVTGGQSLYHTTFPLAGTAIFMGSEANGLPPAVTTILDRHITIPMSPGVDSFSVNAAAAIILYEINRQQVSPR